jgi:hypothetical protein
MIREQLSGTPALAKHPRRPRYDKARLRARDRIDVDQLPRNSNGYPPRKSNSPEEIIIMSTFEIVSLGAIVGAFVVFTVVLMWGNYQTTTRLTG